jgi:hypothetical protein
MTDFSMLHKLNVAIPTLSRAKAIAERRAILLFFREFERDTFVKYDRYLKRIVRPFYELMHRRQKKTGFAVSFHLLVRALTKSGWIVYVNDRALARENPRYPVGLVGFPSILEGWDLRNPALLGPSLYDHPSLAPDLMDDPRFRKYLVLAPWTDDMFRPVYGDACVRWYAGIDTNEWEDASSCPKDIDFLIYDKIRWDHDALAAELLNPIHATLKARGFKTDVIRYRYHDHATYKHLLKRSRAMIFLCEHETQGLAYQEALASNVPVLAWDNGYWLDPLWKRVSDSPIPASSVPFFSTECGERFVGLSAFQEALHTFLNRIDCYEPRKFVLKSLSWQNSAEIYTGAYFSLSEN